MGSQDLWIESDCASAAAKSTASHLSAFANRVVQDREEAMLKICIRSVTEKVRPTRGLCGTRPLCVISVQQETCTGLLPLSDANGKKSFFGAADFGFRRMLMSHPRRQSWKHKWPALRVCA
eukprot:s587_g14.t1